MNREAFLREAFGCKPFCVILKRFTEVDISRIIGRVEAEENAVQHDQPIQCAKIETVAHKRQCDNFKSIGIFPEPKYRDSFYMYILHKHQKFADNWRNRWKGGTSRMDG